MGSVREVENALKAPQGLYKFFTLLPIAFNRICSP